MMANDTVMHQTTKSKLRHALILAFTCCEMYLDSRAFFLHKKTNLDSKYNTAAYINFVRSRHIS